MGGGFVPKLERYASHNTLNKREMLRYNGSGVCVCVCVCGELYVDWLAGLVLAFHTGVGLSTHK